MARTSHSVDQPFATHVGGPDSGVAWCRESAVIVIDDAVAETSVLARNPSAITVAVVPHQECR